MKSAHFVARPFHKTSFERMFCESLFFVRTPPSRTAEEVAPKSFKLHHKSNFSVLIYGTNVCHPERSEAESGPHIISGGHPK